MAETYAAPSHGRFSCPVVALGSTEDGRVSVATLEPWREVTTGLFQITMFPGDHSYLNTYRSMLLDLLTAQLLPLLP